jgi:hypothetical protein
MTHARVRPLLSGLAVWAALVPAAAAQSPQPVEPSSPAQQTATSVTISQDARETRQEFEAILKRLPPAVGRVFRTDPSLMRNQSYLVTYPALASFLQQHPEVA